MRMIITLRYIVINCTTISCPKQYSFYLVFCIAHNLTEDYASLPVLYADNPDRDHPRLQLPQNFLSGFPERVVRIVQLSYETNSPGTELGYRFELGLRHSWVETLFVPWKF